MARKHEYFTDLYTDALIGFAAFTHLPASVVRTAAGYAIRADAGFGRFLLATNGDQGLAEARTDLDTWTVEIHESTPIGADLLATETDRDLVAAYGRAVERLEFEGSWSPVEVALDRPVTIVEGAA
ncbi:hypothetical protein DEU38_10118 [Rhodococcus sp. AG1013]|uniref:hypothetical protein n=1 Tax=Rhodococcus sp. AG1013 TaxID=2183996 RepID=UPI000E0BEEE5|nr:hypothetical protein [Rhodococcus sp. AG1013]RDI35542.1 hypothetical protein DEU38_10118 [Rhodococcus sp. AG1013]